MTSRLLLHGRGHVRVKIRGVNTVHKRLASGQIATYYYHRSTGRRLAGTPGSVEFIASFADAEAQTQNRYIGTLSALIQLFEETKQWRRLAESTKMEYRRVLTFGIRSMAPHLTVHWRIKRLGLQS